MIGRFLCSIGWHSWGLSRWHRLRWCAFSRCTRPGCEAEKFW